jgi:deoxyribodipyrimidine photolyase-related protein
MPATRRLVLVLGDQLDRRSSAFDGFDPAADVVWMAEVREESTHVRSHRARIALFLSAMRHFAESLRGEGLTVDYRRLDDPGNRGTFAGELAECIRRRRPRRLVVVEPGEWRVREALRTAAEEAGVELDIRPDRHFLCSTDEFARFARGRRQLRMEHFYRQMRRRLGVLLDDAGDPLGGRWNFDTENRGAFGREGPGPVPPPRRFPPDEITREVLALVERGFTDHPGRLADFDWPVTAADADAALRDFVDHRLADFGLRQDAMWSGEPWLYHSRLSAAMNLKLLDPRKVVAAAERAHRDGRAPLPAVEGFVRQIIGWREYVRGVYWRFMPDYAEGNFLDARAELPGFYWTGETDCNCLRQALRQTLDLGYAHHIQRLMVTGLYALLLGVEPRQIHEWYLAVYVDAVEWVELPNVIGMSQYADGGVMAGKPYAATGKYIDRMSDYCRGCRFDPAARTGPDACPFTTLYWDFLLRHRDRLADNPRFALQLRNADRLPAKERKAITEAADRHRESVGAVRRTPV